MIQKMKKVSFLVFHKDYDTFLEQLRQLGVVHVIEKEQGAPTDETLQNNITLLSRYNNVIPSLQALADGVQPSGSQVGTLDDYDQLLSDKSAIERRVLQLTQDCKSLEPWGDFSQDNVARLESAGYRLNYFVCDRKLFSEQWVEQYNATIVSDGKQVRFVTVTPVGEEVQVATEQQSLPQVSLSDLQKELAAAEQQLEQNAQSIRQFAADNVGTFISQRDQLVQSINLSKVRLNGEGMAEGKLILLQGWIPAKNVDEVKAELDKDSLYYEIESPTPEDDVPILLSNNKFARLFEPLTHLYMLPQYNELDLTLFFAPFFMLFFGLCLGDMGYGLLMIVALPVFTKLFQLINPNFTKWLVVLFGLSTIICGSLSGSFFGFSLYDLDIPFVKSMKELLYTDNSKMFTLSLVIGVVQILFGMILKAVNLTIQCGFKSALGTIGWLILLLTVGACAVLGIPYGNPVVVALLVIALVGIFLLNSPGKNIFLNIGLGLWDTYNMATGLLGDVLSYVRLFALGLSGGILANVFNQMATGMSPDVPVVGFIVTVIIFLIGHGLNIFMNILGAIVHPMRLTFVEFFKNSGYTGGGVGYNPFR